MDPLVTKYIKTHTHNYILIFTHKQAVIILMIQETLILLTLKFNWKR